MSTLAVGVSPYLADQWLNTLSNIPYTAPLCCFELHNAIPGLGTLNVSAASTIRVAATFTSASGGAFNFTGAPPIWPIVAADTVTHLSAWDALSGGNFLFSGIALAPRTVAIGDQLALSGFALSLLTLASN